MQLKGYTCRCASHKRHVHSGVLEVKEQCLRTLALLGLNMSGDPYAASSEENFVDNKALWASFEFGHFFSDLEPTCIPSGNLCSGRA